MKSHPFRASSILPALILLIASSLTGIAQQPEPRRPERPRAEQERPRVEQEQSLIPELAAPRELAAQDLSAAVPQECKGIRPVVQTHDVADAFSPPGNPVTLSPALAASLSGKPLKGYDDSRVNMVFADSFRLRNCRVCYATLEISVRHDQDAWTNDMLYVQAAPYSPSGVSFIYTGIWNPTTPNPKTLTLALPTAALNNHLFSTSTMPTFLDVFAQDDTDFDYVKLSVWYY